MQVSLNAIPFCRTQDNDDAARTVPFTITFDSTGNNPAVQTFKRSLADSGLGSVQTLYVDNSNSYATTTIIMGQTQQSIVVPPSTQGYYLILASPLDVDFTIVNYGGTGAVVYNVGLQFINVHIDPGVWTGNNAFPGLPMWTIGSGANSIATATIPNFPGLQTYISALGVTAGAATGAIAVQAVLTRVQHLTTGNSMTLNVSAAAGVAPVPIIAAFSPPLPLLQGASATFSLPALGAGNTAANVFAAGFYR
jgi:hypothetical protein